MKESWMEDQIEATGSQSGSLLVLISMLSVVMLVLLAWLHIQAPNQHRYEKKQIRNLSSKLHQTKIVKKISYVIE